MLYSPRVMDTPVDTCSMLVTHKAFLRILLKMKWLAVFSLFLLLCAFPAQAQPASEAPPDGSASADELAAFLDLFFAERMETLHIPGVVFAVVKDGDVFFKKGYGYADVEARTPVDPDATLFQVASVSKLFTATALMQLVEQGRVDLHTDVNHYLKQVQLDPAFGEPVTPAHLLTHTGGFDERNIGYIARDAATVRPLGTYLADRMPPRALPPGTVTSYMARTPLAAFFNIPLFCATQGRGDLR